ncbi:DUF6783 domain-containing protein [Anaerobutyricum hallii]
MYITICRRFRLNEGGVAGYGNRMKAKYTVNWGGADCWNDFSNTL